MSSTSPPNGIQKRIQQAFPQALLLSAFGMSETTGIVTFNRPTIRWRSG